MTLNQLITILQQIADHEDPNAIQIAGHQLALNNLSKVTKVRYIKEFDPANNKQSNTIYMIEGDK